MAIYHFHAQVIGRKSGRSAVAASAYRAGVQLEDERAGKVHDYSRKGGVVHAEILAPSTAPEWVGDREKLWNAVELAEKRKDAQLAREIYVALPIELSREQQIALVRQFVHDQFISKGMVVDIAVHDPDGGSNPHAHIMLTMREIGSDGFGKKNREWNDKKLLEQWREEWARFANDALKRVSVDQRIDHRSHADCGIDLEPTIHVGVKSWHAKQRQGVETPRFKRFSEIVKRNEIRVQRNRRATGEVDAALEAAEALQALQPQQQPKPKANLSSVALELEQQKERQNHLVTLKRQLDALFDQAVVAEDARIELEDEAWRLEREANVAWSRAHEIEQALERFNDATKAKKAAEAAVNMPWQRFLAKIGVRTEKSEKADMARQSLSEEWKGLVGELGFKPKNAKQVRAEIEAWEHERGALNREAEAKKEQVWEKQREVYRLDREIEQLRNEICSLKRELEPERQRQQDRGWDLEM